MNTIQVRNVHLGTLGSLVEDELVLFGAPSGVLHRVSVRGEKVLRVLPRLRVRLSISVDVRVKDCAGLLASRSRLVNINFSHAFVPLQIVLSALLLNNDFTELVGINHSLANVSLILLRGTLLDVEVVLGRTECVVLPKVAPPLPLDELWSFWKVFSGGGIVPIEA